MAHSLIITVRYTVKPGKREEFHRRIVEEGILDVFQHEAGCLKYDYYYPLDSEDDLCLLELWTDEASQKAHASTETFEKLRALKDQYTTNTVLHSYSAEETTR